MDVQTVQSEPVTSAGSLTVFPIVLEHMRKMVTPDMVPGSSLFPMYSAFPTATCAGSSTVFPIVREQMRKMVSPDIVPESAVSFVFRRFLVILVVTPRHRQSGGRRTGVGYVFRLSYRTLRRILNRFSHCAGTYEKNGKS